VVVVRLLEHLHAQLGGFAHVRGRNVGAGGGVAVGVRGTWP
jgi:hypothetical protein